MNEEPGTAPGTSPSSESGGGGGAGSDEQVAQNFFDEWSERIETDIENLKQAMGHLMQVRGSSDHAGPGTNEPSSTQAGASQGEPRPGAAPNASASASGQLGGTAPAGQPSGGGDTQPHSPHWYFRRLFGG